MARITKADLLKENEEHLATILELRTQNEELRSQVERMTDDLIDLRTQPPRRSSQSDWAMLTPAQRKERMDAAKEQAMREGRTVKVA